MLFVGCLSDRKHEYEYLANSLVGLQNAANHFQWNLIDGLETNLGCPVDIVNVLPVGCYPHQYKQLHLPSHPWSHTDGADDYEVGCLNLPLLKQLGRALALRRHLRYKVQKVGHQDILVYSPDLPLLYGVYKLPSACRVGLVVTDLPEYYDLTSTRISALRRLYNALVKHYMKRIDRYVLLTNHMKDRLPVGEKPYMVMEGVISVDAIDAVTEVGETPHGNKKVLLYTGTLNWVYGINNLLKAFSLIPDKDYELWICGAGEAAETIRQLAQTDGRIRFYGYVSSVEVRSLQRQATALVNPRTDAGEYTKYSFPSKTLEYMQSGVPLLAFKLGGIPSEYDSYIQYFESDDPVSMKETIMSLCEQPERQRIGQLAKQFVEQNKTNIVQAKRLLQELF